MANEAQNTGPSNLPGGNNNISSNIDNRANQGSSAEKLQAKEITDLLKERLRLGGDYRDQVKDSLKDLNKAIKIYDDINAKIDVYSATTNNIKKVKQEIFRNDLNAQINLIKIKDLEKQIGQKGQEQIDNYLKSLTDKNKLEDDLIASKKEEDSLQRSLSEKTGHQINGVNNYLSILKEIEHTQISSANVNQKHANRSKEQIAKLHQQKQIIENMMSDEQKMYANSILKTNDLQKQAILREKELETSLSLLNTEELAYLQAKKSDELYKKTSGRLKDVEAFEKKSKSNIGIFGNIFRLFADKLQLGEDVYEAMLSKSKELTLDAEKNGKKSINGWKVIRAGASEFFSSLKEKMKNDPLLKYGIILGGIALAFKGLKKGIDLIGPGAAKAGNALAGMTEDSGNNVRNLTSGISGLVKNIPFVGGLIGGLIDGFSAVLDLIIGIDDKIVKAGRALNMSSSEARALNRHFQDVSYNSGNVYITSKKLLESYVGIADVLEVTNRISDANLETAIMLKDYAGIEYTTLAEIEKVARVNGNTQKGVVKSVLAQVEGVKKLTGIQFNHQKILKEVSSYTGYLGLQFTKYPAQLTKSVLTVKALGMEMKDLDGIADGMLDFQSSISKEFEAQLLTGKDMNLSKLRELSLNNDLAGVALEINKQIGSSGEFLKMNRIQQQAYAEAVGMSRDSLAEMLRKQEYLALLGAKDTDSAREQLRLGLLKYKNQQALSEAMGAEAYQNLINASTQEKLAVTIEKIKQSIVDFIERSGFIEKLENFMNMLTDPNKIKGLLGTIKGAIASFIEVMGEVLADVIEVGGQIKNLFTTGEKGDREEARAYQMAAKIRAGATEFSKNVRGLGEGGKITPAQQATNNQSLAANQYQQNNQSLSNATISNEAKKAKENQTNIENPAKEGTIIRLSVQSMIDTINGRAVVTAVSKDAGVMIDSTTYNKSK